MSKYTLRVRFYQELKDAIDQGDSLKVSLIREIIKEIKLHQIQVKDYADDRNVLRILGELREKASQESAYLDEYLAQFSEPENPP